MTSPLKSNVYTLDIWQSFKSKTEDKEVSFTACLWVFHLLFKGTYM